MNKNENKKQKYEAPAIEHEEEMVAVAYTCNSNFDGVATCRTEVPACVFGSTTT